MIHHFGGLAIKDPDDQGLMDFEIGGYHGQVACLDKDEVHQVFNHLLDKLENDDGWGES